jgi:hypothetical protein
MAIGVRAERTGRRYTILFGKAFGRLVDLRHCFFGRVLTPRLLPQLCSGVLVQTRVQVRRVAEKTCGWYRGCAFGTYFAGHDGGNVYNNRPDRHDTNAGNAVGRWVLEHTYVYEFFKDFAAAVVALVGITVTGTMAGLGLRSFAKFKREKIEERRIEVALDALALAYESKFVFQMIRARAFSSDEHEGGSDVNYSVPGGIKVQLRTTQLSPYAVLKRIESSAEFFERVRRIEPRFMAVFGAETEQIFADFYSARTQLEAAVGQLFEMERIEYDDDDELTTGQVRELKELIYRGPTEIKEKDKIGDLTDGFRMRIEAICRPIVDHQYGKPKSP